MRASLVLRLICLTALGFSPPLAAADTGGCLRYEFEKLSGPSLNKDLEEMSGLAIDAAGSLVHIQDSGNDPYLLFTKRDGTLIEKVRFAEVNADPEELQRASCPWSGDSCFYVFDTGDNFLWRSERNIWAIEEKSLRSAKPRIENLVFTFPDKERIDSEAAAIVGSTIYVFTKERKRSRVYALEKAAWSGGSRQAKFVEELPYRMLTGATASEDGSRILLLNWQGVFILSREGKGAKEGSFYPYRQKVKIKGLAQQEAITLDADQQSFLYTSEHKRFSRDDWGIMRASCVRGK